jgi:protein phosphatase methylesterase 1
MLLLAAYDRMDKELQSAQMSGKFMLIVLNEVGHVIQEDRPAAVAHTFHFYLKRLKI